MPLMLAPSSAEWPRLFLAQRDALRAAFAPVDVDIEHIGSTSVTGLAAKPVIEILVGAASLDDIKARIPALVTAGFTYRPEQEDTLPTRRYFTLTPPGSLRVHAVVRDDTLWRDHLTFRDALRNDDVPCDHYQALKLALALAQCYAHDKSAYTEAKGSFIREVIALSGV